MLILFSSVCFTVAIATKVDLFALLHNGPKDYREKCQRVKMYQSLGLLSGLDSSDDMPLLHMYGCESKWLAIGSILKTSLPSDKVKTAISELFSKDPTHALRIRDPEILRTDREIKDMTDCPNDKDSFFAEMSLTDDQRSRWLALRTERLFPYNPVVAYESMSTDPKSLSFVPYYLRTEQPKTPKLIGYYQELFNRGAFLSTVSTDMIKDACVSAPSKCSTAISSWTAKAPAEYTELTSQLQPIIMQEKPSLNLSELDIFIKNLKSRPGDLQSLISNQEQLLKDLNPYDIAAFLTEPLIADLEKLGFNINGIDLDRNHLALAIIHYKVSKDVENSKKFRSPPQVFKSFKELHGMGYFTEAKSLRGLQRSAFDMNSIIFRHLWGLAICYAARLQHPTDFETCSGGIKLDDVHPFMDSIKMKRDQELASQDDLLNYLIKFRGKLNLSSSMTELINYEAFRNPKTPSNLRVSLLKDELKLDSDAPAAVPFAWLERKPQLMSVPFWNLLDDPPELLSWFRGTLVPKCKDSNSPRCNMGFKIVARAIAGRWAILDKSLARLYALEDQSQSFDDFLKGLELEGDDKSLSYLNIYFYAHQLSRARTELKEVDPSEIRPFEAAKTKIRDLTSTIWKPLAMQAKKLNHRMASQCNESNKDNVCHLIAIFKELNKLDMIIEAFTELGPTEASPYIKECHANIMPLVSLADEIFEAHGGDKLAQLEEHLKLSTDNDSKTKLSADIATMVANLKPDSDRLERVWKFIFRNIRNYLWDVPAILKALPSSSSAYMKGIPSGEVNTWKMVTESLNEQATRPQEMKIPQAQLAKITHAVNLRDNFIKMLAASTLTGEKEDGLFSAFISVKRDISNINEKEFAKYTQEFSGKTQSIADVSVLEQLKTNFFKLGPKSLMDDEVISVYAPAITYIVEGRDAYEERQEEKLSPEKEAIRSKRRNDAILRLYNAKAKTIPGEKWKTILNDPRYNVIVTKPYIDMDCWTALLKHGGPKAQLKSLRDVVYEHRANVISTEALATAAMSAPKVARMNVLSVLILLPNDTHLIKAKVALLLEELKDKETMIMANPMDAANIILAEWQKGNQQINKNMALSNWREDSIRCLYAALALTLDDTSQAVRPVDFDEVLLQTVSFSMLPLGSDKYLKDDFVESLQELHLACNPYNEPAAKKTFEAIQAMTTSAEHPDVKEIETKLNNKKSADVIKVIERILSHQPNGYYGEDFDGLLIKLIPKLIASYQKPGYADLLQQIRRYSFSMNMEVMKAIIQSKIGLMAVKLATYVTPETAKNIVNRILQQNLKGEALETESLINSFKEIILSQAIADSSENV